MKLTTMPITTSRFHKRSSKGSSYKRLLINHQKSINGSKREILRETSPCDNSDDSGLGTDHNADYLYNTALPHPSVFKFVNSQKRSIDDSYSLDSKRHRIVGGKEHDLADQYSFPAAHLTLPNSNSLCVSGGMQTTVPPASKAIRRSLVPTKRVSAPVTLSSQLSSTSRNGKVSLQIVNQPEQQHRARYQTEGSRGAVKDRTGNSFPVVKVTGYNRPATLQVFIGSDQGRVTPHMFYQACRVTGKNSTPCVEKNMDGTVVIEIDIEPSKDMVVTCDCVGILKERNVDVEHRFPEECSSRSKKKSTRCRMIFRAVISNDDGTTETLQIASQSIACTQPPGVPEICKKSLTHCSASGGKELFVLGKNFLKDTHVRFYTDNWEQTVTPDKEFLQQTHLVCVVPPYKNVDIKEAASAKIAIISGNRASEPHTFTYTPVAPVVSPALPMSSTSGMPLNSTPLPKITSPKAKHDSGLLKPAVADDDSDAGLNKSSETIVKTPHSPTDDCENANPVLLWPASNLSSTAVRNCTYVQNDSKMMPPPTVPLRRSSVQMIIPENLTSEVLPNAPPTCQSSGVMSHFSDAACVPVSSCTYLPGQYSERDQQMVAEYSSTFRGISADTPLKTDIVPKIEPLSSDSYTAASMSDTCSQSQLLGGGVACLKASNAVSSDLYPKSQSYSLSSDLYAGGVPVSKGDLCAGNLSTFAGGVRSNGVHGDVCGILSTTSNDSSNFMVSGSFATMNDVAMSTANGSSSFGKTDKLGLAESSYDQTNVERKSPFLFDMKSQQSLVGSLKSSSSCENIRGAVCYKNSLDESSTTSVFQNYHSMNGNVVCNGVSRREDTSEVSRQRVNAECLDAFKSSNGDALPEIGGQLRKRSLDSYALHSGKVDDNCSFVGADASVLDNSVNTVPKLEELVNNAAESHMRAVSKSATSLNLMSANVQISNSACERGSIPLDMYLPTGEQTSRLSAPINGCVPENSPLLTSYQMAAVNQSKNTVSMPNCKSSDDKLANVTGMLKKPDDGVFPSEITQMTENDLLSYINPSCFDEVQRYAKKCDERW